MVGDVKKTKDGMIYVVVHENGTLQRIGMVKWHRVLKYHFVRIFRKFTINETIDYLLRIN
jgi:hypothetical protein